MGYLDDARYARTFAEDRRNLDGWGTRADRAPAARARRRREHIAAALGGRDGAGELEAALELLRRRFRDSVPASERERERALGMLVRKGYDARARLRRGACVRSAPTAAWRRTSPVARSYAAVL